MSSLVNSVFVLACLLATISWSRASLLFDYEGMNQIEGEFFINSFSFNTTQSYNFYGNEYREGVMYSSGYLKFPGENSGENLFFDIFYDEFLKPDEEALYFRESSDPMDIQKALTYIEELFPSLPDINISSIMIFTWDNSSYYQNANQFITMQGVLVQAMPVNFVLFLYEDISVQYAYQTVATSLGGYTPDQLSASGTPDVVLLDETAQATTVGLHGYILGPDGCALNGHACDEKATCVDMEDDSFECICNAGYETNGFTCTDIDECALGTDTCMENQRCKNLLGTYECVRRRPCRG